MLQTSTRTIWKIVTEMGEIVIKNTIVQQVCPESGPESVRRVSGECPESLGNHVFFICGARIRSEIEKIPSACVSE